MTPPFAKPLAMLLICLPLLGCATSSPSGKASLARGKQPSQPSQPAPAGNIAASASAIRPVAYQKPSTPDQGGHANGATRTMSTTVDAEGNELDLLIQTALRQNPKLARLRREHHAAAARAQHADKLPDPQLGTNVFASPLETASGSQRMNMSLRQTLPWLRRLTHQQQQACFEALAIRAEWAAERLRVIAGLRVGWAKLYVVDEQIRTTTANQELLTSLISVANSRIAAGAGAQGDVLLGTVQLSQLQERLLAYRKQRRSIEAELNRLAGRPANLPLEAARVDSTAVIDLEPEAIQQIALESQPEIQSARLRVYATRHGVEVARLQRRPDVTLSANFFFTDDNRPPTPVVHVGEDPWALGVQMSLPVWRRKYDAIRREADWKHQAAHSSVDELSQRYDALILELVMEARRSAETAQLYVTTILPQARQTLASDQQSYSNGSVEFDRVIQNYRSLLTLELGYHEAVGDLAIANARLQQAAGRDLAKQPEFAHAP